MYDGVMAGWRQEDRQTDGERDGPERQLNGHRQRQGVLENRGVSKRWMDREAK